MASQYQQTYRSPCSFKTLPNMTLQ